MNLFETYIKVGLKDEASAGARQLTQTLGSGIKKAASVGLAAVGAASAGMIALTKQAVDEYADYEQLVGGVETLFGAGGKTLEEYAESEGKTAARVRSEYNKLIESQKIVLDNASKAYKTAGLSQNQYIETVTGFSASLLQSLEGDTLEAARLADQALTDMSDNANKMGTDMSMIQNAYQGFAKANYTMLDNLKLGYGGTQTEMRRLIRDAAALDDSIDANSMSFANIVRAINVVQTELGITGTTSKEAATTITGSVNAARAAWRNLVAGFADDKADVEDLTKKFADSVVVAGENIVPKVGQVLKTVGGLAKEYLLEAATAVDENQDVWTSKGKNIGKSLVDGLIDVTKGDESSERIAAGINSLVTGSIDIINDTIRYSGKRISEEIIFGISDAFRPENLKETFENIGNWFEKQLIESFRPLFDIMNPIREVLGKDPIDIDALFPGTDYRLYDNTSENRGGGGGTWQENRLPMWETETYESDQTPRGVVQKLPDVQEININVTTDGSTASDDIAKSVSEELRDIFDRRAAIYG